MGDTATAQVIMNGKFTQPEETDNHTVAMLKLMLKAEEVIMEVTMDQVTTREYSGKQWKQAREDTSS